MAAPPTPRCLLCGQPVRGIRAGVLTNPDGSDHECRRTFVDVRPEPDARAGSITIAEPEPADPMDIHGLAVTTDDEPPAWGDVLRLPTPRGVLYPTRALQGAQEAAQRVPGPPARHDALLVLSRAARGIAGAYLYGPMADELLTLAGELELAAAGYCPRCWAREEDAGPPGQLALVPEDAA